MTYALSCGTVCVAKTIREQLNMIYVKHALLSAKRMIEEGDSISDIPEFEPLSLCKEEK